MPLRAQEDIDPVTWTRDRANQAGLGLQSDCRLQRPELV